MLTSTCVDDHKHENTQFWNSCRELSQLWGCSHMSSPAPSPGQGLWTPLDKPFTLSQVSPRAFSLGLQSDSICCNTAHYESQRCLLRPVLASTKAVLRSWWWSNLTRGLASGWLYLTREAITGEAAFLLGLTNRCFHLAASDLH